MVHSRPVRVHFLVDGYNYLHRARLFGDVSLEQARHRLATRLRALRGKGDEVTIVWDARRAPSGLPRGEADRGVEHEFAHRDRGSADEAILRRLRAAADARGYCVVSDDGEVVRSARQLGAAVRSIADVESRVRGRIPSAPDDDEKPPPPRGSEVDDWLRIFGEDPRP
jgi:predicted RNA-binding protein with PIN domain